jgi:hypothetical protein
MSDYSPSIKIARLYEKTSKSGNVYFTGRLGMAKIAILKSKEVAEDGSPIWDVLMSEAPARSGATRATKAPAKAPEAEQRDPVKPPMDDAIPF